MISLPISINQLLDAIKNLTESDKKKVLTMLQGDFNLSPEQEEIVLQREQMHKSGQMETFTWGEVKTELGQ